MGTIFHVKLKHQIEYKGFCVVQRFLLKRQLGNVHTANPCSKYIKQMSAGMPSIYSSILWDNAHLQSEFIRFHLLTLYCSSVLNKEKQVFRMYNKSRNNQNNDFLLFYSVLKSCQSLLTRLKLYFPQVVVDKQFLGPLATLLKRQILAMSGSQLRKLGVELSKPNSVLVRTADKVRFSAKTDLMRFLLAKPGPTCGINGSSLASATAGIRDNSDPGVFAHLKNKIK